MSGFVIEIDDFCDEIFHKLEQISEAGNGHQCYVTAINRVEASKAVAARLESFIATQLQPVKCDNE